MKKSRVFFLGVLLSMAVIVLAISAFLAGNAYAATGCFNDTNGHWAETFICWMKDNNITTGIGGGNYGPEQFVTRAQMAVFMQRASNVPPAVGEIVVNAGFSGWEPVLPTYSLSYYNYATGTYIRAPSAGTYTLVSQPDLPVVLYGKSLQLVGVEICYEASPGNYLNEVRLRTYTHVSGLGGSNLRFTDSTDRTDTACRYYVISPSPIVMTAEMGAEIFADVTWTAGITDFGFGRVSYVFQPTGTTAVTVSSLGNENVSTLELNTSEIDDSPEVKR